MAIEAILPATFVPDSGISGYLVDGTVFFGTAVPSAHDCTIQQSKPPGRRRDFGLLPTQSRSDPPSATFQAAVSVLL